MTENAAPPLETPPSRRKRFTEGMLDNELILRTLGVAPGQTIVDAGCGGGYMSLLFALRTRPGGRVYALDRDAHFLKDFNLSPNENLTAIACDITRSVPLAAGCADLAFISMVIHSLARHRVPDLMREIRRLLKPGGLLGVVEMKKRDTPFGPPPERRYSPGELCAAVPLAPVKTVSVAEHFYLQIFRSDQP